MKGAGQCLGDVGLAGAGGAHHEDVALLELHIFPAAEEDPLVMVVDRDGEGDLRLLLPDDVLVQDLLNLPGLGELVGQAQGGVAVPAQLLLQHAHAQLDALVADAGPGALDHPPHLLLPLAAEGAAQRLLCLVTHFSQIPFLFRSALLPPVIWCR